MVLRGELVLALALALAFAACGSPQPPGGPTTTPPIGPTPTPPPGWPRPPFTFTMSIDPNRSACEADADCQILASCECDACVPSKRMHVQMCSERCKVDACKDHHATCERRLCTTEGAHASWSPSAMDDVSEAGQLMLDDPRLARYFHEGPPERASLVVAWEPGQPHPRWTKFGKPVEIVDGLPDGPYLLPSFVLFETATAVFNLWLEPEETMLYGALVKRDGWWSVSAIEVYERRK